MQVTIKVTGSRQIGQKLNKLGTKLFQMRPEMNEIGSELTKYYSGKAFVSRGQVFGARWRPLSESYKAEKAREYPGRGPLVRTGKMQRSFTHKASDKSVDITNTAKQFKYHQSSKLPRKKIPRREMMGVNHDVKNVISDIISEGVRRKLREVKL